MERLTTLRKSVIKRLIAVVLISGGLVLYMMETNPNQANLFMTFIPLLMMWVVIFLSVSFLDLLLKRTSGGIIFSLSASIATVITFLIMFSALGSVGMFDVVLLISLAILVVFYIKRTWSK